MSRRSIVLSALVVIAAVLAVPAVASSAVAAPAAATQASGPSAVPTQHQLAGVSCLSPKDCIAVGLNLNAYSHMGGGLAETWNGSGWKAVTLKLPKGSISAQLTGVSCIPKAFCVAVGLSLNSAERGLALAETLKGGSWTPSTLPGVKGTNSVVLTGVSCATLKSCVASGEGATSAGLIAIGESWNGTHWTPSKVPAVKGASSSQLSGISCTSATHCIAVGSYSAKGITFPLIESWNGNAWTRMAAPSPAGSRSTSLAAVSCGSANVCVAVGSLRRGTPITIGFTEVWRKGKSWAVSDVPWPKGVTGTGLWGVSCVSATSCVAVGDSGGVHRAAAATWNSKTWTVRAVAPPPAGKISYFVAVVCPPKASCVAVGHQGADSLDGTGLSGIWNGKSWKLKLAL